MNEFMKERERSQCKEREWMNVYKKEQKLQVGKDDEWIYER